MADLHDIIALSVNGEKMLGVVIEHYTNPLDDFFITYSEHSLYKVYDTNQDAELILDGIIILACDDALADFKLQRQRLKDMQRNHSDYNLMANAMKNMSNYDFLDEDFI